MKPLREILREMDPGRQLSTAEKLKLLDDEIDRLDAMIGRDWISKTRIERREAERANRNKRKAQRRKKRRWRGRSS